MIISIDTITDLTGSYQIDTTDTKYAHPPKTIDIGGNDYKITSFTQDQNLIVTGDSLPVATEITLPIPKYWHGTLIATNVERANIPNQSNETPFVYFAETFTEDYNGMDSGLVDIPIQLFFLDESRYDQYETGSFYSDIINPMRALCEDTINRMYKDKNIQFIDDIRITNNTKFATFIADRGLEQNLFSEELTGVELRCTLRVRQKSC